MSRKIALLIGVNKYGEGIPPLSAPVNDVAAMKRVLENPEMGGFEVETLLDPDPIIMRKEIKKLFASCGKEDLVLLFFSGHGITDDENKLYLATRITAKDDFDATAVPASFIQQQSKNSYTKRQVIVLDCCYSGAFAEGWQTKSVGVDLKEELGAEGRVVLTSSTATQTSFQQEGEELSLYTQYLLEGIETGAADEDEDGKIHAHELHQYAKSKVKEVKPKQEPGIILDREGFNILLSRTPVKNPELEFRRLVEKYASKGKISSYRRETLKLKQQEFLLTDEQADKIISSVLEPFRIHLVNLERYRENYRQQIEQRYPIDTTLVRDIRDWGQQVLGLQDEDIAKLEQEVNVEKEAGQERYNQKLQQYKQKFLIAVEREYPLTQNTREQINIWQKSLGLRDEDIKLIEQPILAAKYQAKQIEEKQEQVSTSELLVTSVAHPNAQTTYSDSKSQPKSKPAFSTTIAAKYHFILRSCLNKPHILFGGIAAALVLALTLPFLFRTSPSEQNVPNKTIPNSASIAQRTAKESGDKDFDKQEKDDNQEAIAENNQPVELISDKGIDYTQLRNYLEAKNWQEADLETYNVMLKAAEGGILTEESIRNFPCNDLNTINSLWQHYSSDRFGFSIQNKEYQNLAKSINPLGDKLGWRQSDWMTYNYLWEKFHPNVPAGHLPARIFRKEDGAGMWYLTYIRGILERTDSCNL